MKKIMSLVVAILILCAASHLALAEAGQQEIKKLKTLGTDPFVGDKAWALKKLGFSPADAEELLEKMEADQLDGWVNLKKVDRLAMVHGERGFYPEAEMDFPDGHLEPAKVYRAKSGNEVIIPPKCNNLSRFIVPPVKVVTPLPPAPLPRILPPPPSLPVPPQPPKLYSQPLQKALEVMYQEAVCPDCQLDAATGGVWQKYSDGAKDYSAWLYAAIRCRVWTDADGNIHKPGVYFNGSRWTGNWNNMVDFQGQIKTFGLEHRVETPKGQEYIFRLGYLTRQESSSSADMWGAFASQANFKALSFEAILDDTSRINELWLPRFKAGIGLVTELSRSRNANWTNAMNGQIINFSERPNTISGLELKFEPYIVNDRRKLVTLSAEAWADFLFNGDNVAKLTPYFGILGNSLKVGYQLTNRNTNGSHAIGSGLAWQFSLYDLYAYFKYKGWQPKQKSTTTFDADDPASILFSDAQAPADIAPTDDLN